MALPSSVTPPHIHLSSHPQNPKPHPIPTTQTLTKRLLRKGVNPTPKILHNLRKKETLKSIRRSKKQQQEAPADGPHPDDADNARFRAAAAEYRALMSRLRKPWEGAHGGVELRGVLDSEGKGKAERERLEELREMLEERKKEDKFGWLLNDDVEEKEEEEEVGGVGRRRKGKERKLDAFGTPTAMWDEEKIALLVKRFGLSS